MTCFYSTFKKGENMLALIGFINQRLEFLNQIIPNQFLREILVSAAILIVSSLIAKFGISLIESILHKLASKTRTTLDNELVKALKKPSYFAVIILGFYFAVFYITALNPYEQYFVKTFLFAAIIWGAYTSIKIADAVLLWYTKEIAVKTETKIDDKYAPIFKKVVNIFIYLIALIAILRALGIEITPLVASLGIGGLAVALALQDTLSNFFSGFYIMSDKNLNVGDFIKVEGWGEGFIHEIGTRTTKIRTLPNTFIIIPNAKLSQSVITNYSVPEPEMSVIVPIGVSYSSDLEKVEKVTVKVAKEVLHTVPGAVKSFEPFIRYLKFGDSNIEFSVILRVEEFTQQYPVVHEFIKRLKKAYDKEGIEISYPVRKIVK